MLLTPLELIVFIVFQSGLSEWRKVFFISAAVYVFGAVFYLVFGSGKEQSWSKSCNLRSFVSLPDPVRAEEEEEGDSDSPVMVH